jgi:hypothetical protein
MIPKESYRKYRLYVWFHYPHKDAKEHWRPIGCDETTLKDAENGLKADLNLWKDFPNPKYYISETIHYLPTVTIVKEGIRK